MTGFTNLSNVHIYCLAHMHHRKLGVLQQFKKDFISVRTLYRRLIIDLFSKMYFRGTGVTLSKVLISHR